jgi:hypothetical protein
MSNPIDNKILGEILRIKGEIIDKVNYIEMSINKIVSIYFAKKGKEVELSGIIKALNNPSLLSAVEKILDEFRPRINGLTTIKELEEAIKLRNNFAHSVIAPYPDHQHLLGITIMYIDKKSKEHYVKKDYLMNEITDNLEKLHNMISPLIALTDILANENK